MDDLILRSLVKELIHLDSMWRINSGNALRREKVKNFLIAEGVMDIQGCFLETLSEATTKIIWNAYGMSQIPTKIKIEWQK